MKLKGWSILLLGAILSLASARPRLSGNMAHLELTASSSAQSRSFFVSPQGDDKNPGTIKQPLLTISEAEKKMQPGDTCFIRTGTYRELVKVSKDHLTFKNYKEEKVIVTGLDLVSKWTKHKDNIFKAEFVPQEKDANPSLVRHIGTKGGLLTQVFANDKLLVMARYPNLNGDLLNWENHGAKVKIFPGGSVHFPEAKEWPFNFWAGGIFHAMVEKKFAPVQGVIGDNQGNRIVCNQMTAAWKSSSETDFKKFLFTQQDGEVSGVGKGFITNHLNALDTENEWYWDKQNNNLYVWPPEGKDPNSLKIEAQSRTFAFLIRDRTGVKIKGIHIIAAGIDMRNTKECVVDRCTIVYHVPYYIHSNEYDGYSTFSIVEGNGNIVKNCHIANSWGCGVLIDKGVNNSLENNLIENINWMGSYNGNVQLGGRGTVVHRNTLRKSGRFLIYGIGVKAGRITYNDMYDCMLIGQDGGAFYTNGALGEGTEIGYNWIHNVKGVAWERAPKKDHNITVGVYLDGGCKDFNVHHNVIWKMKYGVLMNPFGGNPPKSVEGNRVDYNTCWVTGDASIVTQNSKLYANNSFSGNLANKKVGAIGEKKDNHLDEDHSLENMMFKPGEYFLNVRDKSKAASVSREAEKSPHEHKFGANEGRKFWRPGADTTLIMRGNYFRPFD
jgi:hypothetical protein